MLSECPAAENAEAAQEGVQYEGPPGGYCAPLRDGTTLRIRYVKKRGALVTEYRISSRWSVPPPLPRLTQAVRKVMEYFKTRRHITIPFSEAARHDLLGAQLEQSLACTDASALGDSVAEAQHGAAAGQIGIWAALVAIVRWAAAENGPAEIEVTEADVESFRSASSMSA